jgi:hypothetical protein
MDATILACRDALHALLRVIRLFLVKHFSALSSQVKLQVTLQVLPDLLFAGAWIAVVCNVEEFLT